MPITRTFSVKINYRHAYTESVLRPGIRLIKVLRTAVCNVKMVSVQTFWVASLRPVFEQKPTNLLIIFISHLPSDSFGTRSISLGYFKPREATPA